MSFNMLFDWAERSFPSLFPSGPSTATVVLDGALYYVRYYPASGNYLGITLDGAVWGLGPVTTNQVVPLGQVTDYTCAVVPAACQPAAGPATISKVWPWMTNALGRTEYIVEGSNLPANQPLALELTGCSDAVAMGFGSSTQSFSCVRAQAGPYRALVRATQSGALVADVELALEETFGLVSLLAYTGPREAPWVELPLDADWLKSATKTSGVGSWIAYLNLPRSTLQDLSIEFDRPATCEFMHIRLFTDETRRVPSGFPPGMQIEFNGEEVVEYSGVEDHGKTPRAMPPGHYAVQLYRGAGGSLAWRMTHPDGSRTGGLLRSDGLMASRSIKSETFREVWTNVLVLGFGAAGCAFQNLRITDRGQLLY